MPVRILCALITLALLAIPTVQQAIALGLHSRFYFGLLP